MPIHRSYGIRFGLNLLVLGCAAVIAFPVVWIVLMSLKTQGQVMAWPPQFVFQPTLETSACCSTQRSPARRAMAP